MTDKNGVVEIKDFTLPGDEEPKRFRIRDDVFEAVSTIPIGLLPEVVAIGSVNNAGTTEQLEKMLKVFDILLYDESAALLRERVKDKKKPISDKHIRPIVEWLLEEYGLRPTQLSENSSDSSDTADESTTSTDGASLEVLISASSPSLDS